MPTAERMPVSLAQLPPAQPTRVAEAAARRALRAQIARLEHALGAVLVDLREPTQAAVGGTAAPRLLGLGDLERERDRLVALLDRARRRLRDRDAERDWARARLEAMFIDPARHRFERVSHAELGEPGCSVYMVRPRLGLLGMLAGWWEVKLSSGCP